MPACVTGRPHRRLTGRFGSSWPALACLAGMACKEVMVTAPLVVLLFERTLIAGSFRRALRQSWPLYVGLSLGWGLLFYLNCSAPRSDSAGFHLGLPAYVWWFTQAKVLLMYLKLAAWPWPLSIHYELPYLTTLGAAWPWLLLVMLLGIATLVLLWRRSALGFVGACVFLILSPTLVVPIITEVAAERRMYLPLAALVTLVVAGGYWLIQPVSELPAPAAANRKQSSPSRPDAFAAIAAVLLALALAAVSYHRLAAYHDDITLWSDVLQSQPDDSWAHNNLGRALVDAGRVSEGVEHYRQALRINPDLPDALHNLGLILASQGRSQEAVELYQHALRIQPNHADALNSLGSLLAEEGRLQEAIELYQRALRIRPGHADAHNNLGNALSDLGHLPEAVEQYLLALRFKPDHAIAHYNLGNALRRLGNKQGALDHYLQATQFDPMLIPAYLNVADVCAELHRTDQSIAAADKALQLARSAGNTALVAKIETWLAAHRPQQPAPQ